MADQVEMFPGLPGRQGRTELLRIERRFGGLALYETPTGDLEADCIQDDGAQDVFTDFPGDEDRIEVVRELIVEIKQLRADQNAMRPVVDAAIELLSFDPDLFPGYPIEKPEHLAAAHAKFKSATVAYNATLLAGPEEGGAG